MIKKPIPIFFNLDGKQSVQSVSAVIHIEDNRTEALDLSLLQGGEHIKTPLSSTVTARFVRVKDKILISDNVHCTVQENGNILIPIDNAAAKMLVGEIKIEVNITDDNDILTTQFPLVIRVNNTILADSEISPESEGTIPELLEEAKRAAQDAQQAAEEATQALNSKQNKLTAGENITIDEDNVISATGGTDNYVELQNLPRLLFYSQNGSSIEEINTPFTGTLGVFYNGAVKVTKYGDTFYLDTNPKYAFTIRTSATSYDVDNTSDDQHPVIVSTAQNRFTNLPSFVSAKFDTNVYFVQFSGANAGARIQFLYWMDSDNTVHSAMRFRSNYYENTSEWKEIKDGVSVTNAEINSEGHLIITLSDGTKIDAGAVGTPKTDIANAVVTLSASSFVYDGASKAPTVSSVVLNGQPLTVSIDYVVVASPAANAGTYTVSVNGIGDYTGVVTANWSITKAQAEIYGDDSIAISGLDEPVSKTYTTNGDGAFSFTISGNIATISNNGGVVTITPTAYGAATMTITVAEGTNYLGTTKTVSVTVEELQTATVFGVVWDYSLESPVLARLTPQADPLGVVTNVPSQEPTACVGNDGNGQSDFDNYMPWKGMDRYNYVNGQVVDFVDYSNGETFVYIPEFWSKIVNDTINSKMYIYISSEELEGFTKHLGSGRYVARYPCDNNFLSVPGSLPKVNTSLSQFREGITAIDNKHFQFDIHTYMARNLLYLVECVNYNSQAMIGEGITSDSSAHVSGETDILTYHTGRVGGTNNQSAVQYRWIENPFGNIWNLVDGILIQSGSVYICKDKTKYANSITNGYNSTGLTTPTGTWHKTDNCYDNCYLIPATSGSSDTTYTCDNYYYQSGLRELRVGGHYGGESSAGLFYWYGFDVPDFKSATVSSRSILIPGGES